MIKLADIDLSGNERAYVNDALDRGDLTYHGAYVKRLESGFSQFVGLPSMTCSSLLELANAYRTIASGIFAEPYVIRTIVRGMDEVTSEKEMERSGVDVNDPALLLIQEGLRSVVRIPTGTAHALNPSVFPIAVMGKTGTTNQFRDALFVGSTYGRNGITVAVRVGFDDNRTLGPNESGGRLALPVFKELMLRVYHEKLVGPVPMFPAQMEQNISDHLAGRTVVTEASVTASNTVDRPPPLSVRVVDDREGSQRLP